MTRDTDSVDPPPPLLAFLELFGAGRFWDSHEVLEGPWRERRSDFYQGLILYASAFVHWERRNAHGVTAQAAKAVERLAGYPSPYLGLDVGAIRRHCARLRAVVDDDPEGWPERVAPLPLVFRSERVRGDEPELAYPGSDADAGGRGGSGPSHFDLPARS